MLNIISIIWFSSVLWSGQEQVTRAKFIEAKSMLYQIYALQKNNFYLYSKYSDDIEAIGFDQEPLVVNGGQANYKIEMVYASQDSFLAEAVSVVDFDGDGVYNVWQIDQNKQLIERIKD